jgi:hypothetical protein
MASATLASWPLWAFGVLVAGAFYVGLGYLVFSGARLALIVLRRLVQDQRLRQRAASFGGQAHPTLLEVAVSRSRQPVAGPAPRPADRGSQRRGRERRQPARRAA